jgi:hypothetical protein
MDKELILCAFQSTKSNVHVDRNASVWFAGAGFAESLVNEVMGDC